MNSARPPSPLASLVDEAPRAIFVTGKGGVGKTSVACAVAVLLAERPPPDAARRDGRRRVLLVSTDPASNLDEVLGTSLSGTPTPVPGVPGLSAMNIDPVATARAYRERLLAPYRGVLPAAAVASVEEQLSGACTVEVAAFEHFARLLVAPEPPDAFDHVVFDTAPTGHTLRLLELPAAWSAFLDASASGASCLGPLSALRAQRGLYGAARDALVDPRATLIVLVARPDHASLAEGERARAELRALGVRRWAFVLNGVFVATDRTDALALDLERRGRAAVATLPPGLAALPRAELPLVAFPVVGVDAVRAFADGAPAMRDAGAAGRDPGEAGPTVAPSETWDGLVRALARRGHGVVLTMGKGGVGKTHVAVGLAQALAGRGLAVHLTTTDPAGHVAAISAPTLTVDRIDPRREVAAYAAEVLAAAEGLDADGRALLEEDLRSPCTEEIAVFRALARVVAQGRDRFVIVDTAPTGHTVLLLDAALAYHRDVARSTGAVPDEVRALLPRLRDPAFASVVLVALPEPTPVHEAATLQDDLRRAGIPVAAWVVNRCLTPLAVTDPVLVTRRRREARCLAEVASLSSRVVWLPQEFAAASAETLEGPAPASAAAPHPSSAPPRPPLPRPPQESFR